MAAAAAPPQQFTVFMAMRLCGLNDPDANEIATQLFRNDFMSCKDKTEDDLKDSYKTFAAFTQAQGQIRLNPLQKDNIKAFNQWVKDQYRLGLNPAERAFPINDVTQLLQRAKSHAAFVANKDSISAVAKPDKFTSDMKWQEWSPSFVNYLRAIPGRDGVPLKYVIRKYDAPDPTPNADFLDDYVANAPLHGPAFVTDSALVHTLLVNLINQNTEAEALIKVHEHERDGRKDWKALCGTFEGHGIFGVDIGQAERDLDNLVYQGENKPIMYWAKFEQRLNQAFATYVQHEGRRVHSDEMKLRTLLKKVRVDWLQATKTSIDVELNRSQINYTYEEALLAFRTEVNRKFPPGASASRIKRTVAQLESQHGGRGGRYNHRYGRGGGRGRGFGRGRANSGRFGRGPGKGRGGRSSSRSIQPKLITLVDGSQIEYHPAWRFEDHIFEKFTSEQKEMLRKERRQYAERQGYGGRGNPDLNPTTRTIQQLQAKIDDLESRMSVPTEIPEQGPSMAQVSQITQETPFGGRNEQAAKRMRHRNESRGRSDIASIETVRKVSATETIFESHQPEPRTPAQNECDTNADTCCLGQNFVILEYTRRTADVYAYDKSIKPLENVPIVSGATAWDDPITKQTVILVINEALYYGTKLDHSLINPNQIRHYGIDFWDNPFDKERGLHIHADSTTNIELETKGVPRYCLSPEHQRTRNLGIVTTSI